MDMRLHASAAIFVLWTAAAAAQSASLSVTVTDENGVAVPSARVLLDVPNAPMRCQTDFAGRCRFLLPAPGTYALRVEKEGFYALVQPSVQVSQNSAWDVTLSHQQEVREVVDVQESPPAIDPAEVASQQTLSGLDVLNIPYPATHDYRNALNFIPGVVQDNFGQIHVAGAQTYQTLTLLDGFNVTQPANGQLLVRVSTDAFRSIQVEPSRESAEYGKGSGGALLLNTGIGDDHFRFAGTDFIPSFQNKHGWRFDQFLPRFTFSGPVRKAKAWFYNAFDGDYENTIYTDLPVGQDNDYSLRVGNLTKLQTNITSRNILTTSFLLNHLHDDYPFLSPQFPQKTNPSDTETAYVGSMKDQHYFAGGELLEAGFGFDQYELELTPYGTLPFFLNNHSAGGNYYLSGSTRGRRWQALSNLYLPPQQWHGRHDFKFGVDIDRISYDANFARQPISFLTDKNPLTSPDECLTAVHDQEFPCTRYSTFSPAPFHQTFNSEASVYVQDRWTITNHLLLEAGLRFDWDQIIRGSRVSPRLAGTYVLDNSGNTKFSAGIGIVYDATPIFLIARPFSGTRQDTFYTVNENCIPECVTTTGPIPTTFTANTQNLDGARFLNWSVGLEKKLPRAIYMKAEFLQKRGVHGLVYDNPTGAPTGDFVLQNRRDDRYHDFQISLRHNFRGNYMLMGSYTRSRARSNQALDFNVDNPILSPQQPGPYPWDTPNRFLSWGYLPFFKLPIIHEMEIAYSVEARTGFPFTELNDQGQIIGQPGAHRFPNYFSLNIQLEKRFHLFGYYWALRGGFNNITGRCDPFAVNSTIDSTHPAPTFGSCQGRAFTSRIRLLGRK